MYTRISTNVYTDIFIPSFRRGKKGRDKNESEVSGPSHSRQYSLDEATGEVQLRRKTPSSSKLAAHQRFSLSVLDDPVSEVVANV